MNTAPAPGRAKLAAAPEQRRARARVDGIVQGVGFRPYVYRLATELRLSGYVLNDAHGVLLEVQGSRAAVAEFFARLVPEAPPLAVLERVSSENLAARAGAGFSILDSVAGAGADAPVAPDSATCDACLRELFDPADRRFRYPFINCTDCGPRFTIVRGVPYDRPATTMAGFRMCERCQAEYDDPGDRRFHAQPNACPVCGPSVSLRSPAGEPLTADDPIVAAGCALRDGLIVAVKGIGGYHLACRADDERAVAVLRARKHREDKPFALMAATGAQAGAIAELQQRDLQLLGRPERPIVVAPRQPDARVAPSVAPGSRELGVMLPYSPLHHLLLRAAGTTLVMTSGNVSDEPIAFVDQDALGRLGAIADLFLVHDRPIETRTDDSVMRVNRIGSPSRARPMFLRRSRGYVPVSLPLPGGAPRALLACGAELKSTFCVAKGERAWVSHHIGDLENFETLESFTIGIEHFERLFAVAPEVVAHDLHPEYLATKYALDRDGVELLGVQHHHAHLAACLAEYGEPGPAVGAIFDGTGYGTDGTVWGGEILYGDLTRFRRVGMLLPVRLPGGERAVRQPWRMACAWLAAAGQHELPPALVGRIAERRWRQVGELVRTGIGAPVTTSMGRLFDAAAAITGVRTEVNYEGQAAIELEAACDPHERGSYPIEIHGSGASVVIDPRPTLGALAADVARGAALGQIGTRFHAAIAQATVAACRSSAGEHQTELVVLSGGVFQNRRLLEAASAALEDSGLRVLVPTRLPINDGGISYGQAAVAAAHMRGR